MNLIDTPTPITYLTHALMCQIGILCKFTESGGLFSFLHSYDKHALFIRNRAFFDEPRSLQCDIVCRVFFVPFCVFLFCCQGYYWFMMNGVVVDTPKK